jgi:heme/copper-type cytochrome/quinol oxidase subunit 3
MSSVAVAAHAPPVSRQVLGVTNGKMAMWLFLGSDGMSFMGLIASYVAVRWSNHLNWPNPPDILAVNLTALNTFILICSSVTMVMAFSAAQRGDVGKLKLWLGGTILGGCIFLGIQVYEYQHLIHAGLTPWSLPAEYVAKYGAKSALFGATFYACTCFHGCHVFSGVVYLSLTLIYAARGRWSVSSIELAGLYWHFVDLVWIVIFTIIYLF